ncbi:hypothetical protein EV363DRAFT_1341989 [Boletus edulis]|nr:hypothetical protein EV363DRAFT_1341989 [Boletus edulis]
MTAGVGSLVFMALMALLHYCNVIRRHIQQLHSTIDETHSPHERIPSRRTVKGCVSVRFPREREYCTCVSDLDRMGETDLFAMVRHVSVRRWC